MYRFPLGACAGRVREAHAEFARGVLAQAFPNSTFTGLDISAEALDLGRAEAHAWGLRNVHFVQRDVAALGIEAEFDLITAFDAIHDQAFPGQVLASIYRALKPGGALLMADVAGSSRLEDNLDLPFAPFAYSVSHCMSVSLAHGGEGLGTMWGEHKVLELLSTAGFAGTEIKQLDADWFNNDYIARK